jgi:hypothetical protein
MPAEGYYNTTTAEEILCWEYEQQENPVINHRLKKKTSDKKRKSKWQEEK